MWVVGLPVAALWVLFRNGKYLERLEKENLPENDAEKITQIAKKYRFIYAGYHAEYFYWEILITFRKLAMIAAGVFLSMVTP